MKWRTLVTRFRRLDAKLQGGSERGPAQWLLYPAMKGLMTQVGRKCLRLCLSIWVFLFTETFQAYVRNRLKALSFSRFRVVFFMTERSIMTGLT